MGQLSLDSVARFSGWAFNPDGPDILQIKVLNAGDTVLIAPVQSRREEIAAVVPHLPAAANCGFEFELKIPSKVADFQLKLLFSNGVETDFVTIELENIFRQQQWFSNMAQAIKTQCMPPGDLIFLTQGHADVAQYQNSIIPFLYNLKKYLNSAGIEVSEINSVLDIGCGTGRSLLAWYLDNPDRKLYGCDINSQLIKWAKQHTPRTFQLYQNGINPPLPFATQSFDFIQLISVFTHLSLTVQREWLQEIKRYISNQGVLLITLHGRPYVKLFKQLKLSQFDQQGYLEEFEQAEGSNHYSSYHDYTYARNLFNEAGFAIHSYHPMGKVAGKRIVFPLAAQQDIYLLKKIA